MYRIHTLIYRNEKLQKKISDPYEHKNNVEMKLKYLFFSQHSVLNQNWELKKKHKIRKLNRNEIGIV